MMGLLVMTGAVSVVMVAASLATVGGVVYAWLRDPERRWAR